MRNDQNSYSKVTKFRIREIRFTMQIKFKILTTVVDTTLHMIGTMDQPMTDARALIMVAIGILNMVDIAGILFICHYYFFFIKNVNFIKIISWKIGIRDFSLHSPFFNHWPTIKFFFFLFWTWVFQLGIGPSYSTKNWTKSLRHLDTSNH